MNKYLIYAIGVLLLLLTVFFFLWKGEIKTNAILEQDLNAAQQQIIQLTKYNEEKETKIKEIQVKYNNIMSSYVGTECENQKVSAEMIQALRTLGEENE